MKKTLVLAVLVVLVANLALAGGMWKLVSQQVSGGKFYCTYQLEGTSVQKVISGGAGCQQFIYEP
ncbi:MAG: hypothetical protein Q7U05_11145 [Polaromonas sp.]|nr:hypothetical protein [Polaromonas sp.]